MLGDILGFRCPVSAWRQPFVWCAGHLWLRGDVPKIPCICHIFVSHRLSPDETEQPLRLDFSDGQ